MSDSVDSTNPGGAAAGDAPLIKLFLRQRDPAVTGVLLGIGSGQGDPYIDSTWEQTESNAPEAGIPSLLPFRLYQAELIEVMSSSEPLHSGPSYTVSTQSVSHLSNLHLEEVIQHLIDNPMPNHSLFWIPEFSWPDPHLCFDDQDAGLCFDGQSLGLPATRDGQSLGGGPSSAHEFSICQRSLPLEVASAICSVSTDFSLSENSFKGEFIRRDLSAHEEIALQKTVDNIVEILADDFIRSYAPQKQSLAAKRKLDDQSSNTPTKRSRATTTRKGAKAGNRKGQTIDGDGESEDEESSGHRHSPIRN